MVRQHNTRVVPYGSGSGNSRAFYLPAILRTDSTYPFTEKQENDLEMYIGKGKIIIKAKKTKNKKGDGKNGR